jgi:phage gpG-like protein
MAGVVVKVQAQEVKDNLAAMIRRGGDLSPVLRSFGEYMYGSIQRNFDAEGRPEKWQPLKLGTLQGWLASRKTFMSRATGDLTAKGKEALGGRKILTDKGLLRGSVYAIPGSMSLMMVAGGAAIPYAAIQQFGGKTAPHEIVAKNAKALATNIGFFKRVQHPGSDIPARPYMVFQTEDLAHLEEMIAAFVVDGKML